MKPNGPIPDFFIIGAPKCGTTAMASYLADHPHIFFSAPKEPHFWDDDHEGNRKVHELWTLDDYLGLFRSADPVRHHVIGEGSTTYLQSHSAVTSIMQFNPLAKFLVMLRNPVEVAHGMHGELIRHFHEDVADFEQAWRLQDERAAGRSLPASGAYAYQLQYRDVATFAPQLRRLFDAVPAEQRLILVFDDFVKDTASAYRCVLKFLGLADDGRTEFPRVNQARIYRFGALGRFYHSPPRIIERPIRLLRSRVNAHSGLLKDRVKQLVSRNESRTKLRPEFAAELRAVFRDDIARISEMIGRDLTHWTAEPSDAPLGDSQPTGFAASANASPAESRS